MVESLGFRGSARGPLVGLRRKIYDGASDLHSFVIERQQRSSLFDENQGAELRGVVLEEEFAVL